MKRIPFVPDIQMESPDGEPYFKVPGTGNTTTLEALRMQRADGTMYLEPNTPWKVRQLAFLLERITDPEFAKDMDAIDAEILRDDVRGMLKRQAKEAGTRGYWELDDKPALALSNATMKTKGPLLQTIPALQFNFVPFIRAVKDMTTPEEKPAEKSATNGAAAQAS